ncbi:hypothetical protein FRC12_016566 [Ceratobasidium sp. 428]|nr:hypothetical protein FRC12_016566 [Ceratobasidium sp. 428]
MHKHLIFEELIDWSEPMALFLPDSQLSERGLESQETATQAEREKTALLAHYPSGAIPPSPAELPASHPTGDDAQTKMMLAGEDVDSITEKPVSVAELLAKMGGPPASTTESTAPMQFGSLKDLGIDPNTFTQMLQQHNIAPVTLATPPEPAPAAPPAQSHHGPGPEWGAGNTGGGGGGGGGGGRGGDDGYGPSSYYDDHGPRSRYEDRGGRGGRGRGRGRGGRPDNDRGQKVCYFYPLGK